MKLHYDWERGSDTDYETHLANLRSVVDAIGELLEEREVCVMTAVSALGVLMGDLIVATGEQVSEDTGRRMYEFVATALHKHCQLMTAPNKGVTLQ